MKRMADQLALFAEAPLPSSVPGLLLVPDAVTADRESEIAALIDAAPLAPFQFGQWEGKRLTVNYGSAYDYQRARPTDAPPLPAWLERLRDELAPQVGREARPFVQGLLIRYDPGAGIGWHRDRPQYGEVIGLSLSSPVTMRLRRRKPDGGFERVNLHLPARSLYLLSGTVREHWEHSIAPVGQIRRSVTLRTMR